MLPLAVALVVFGVALELRARWSRVTWWRLLWRWHTGAAWHGQAVSLEAWPWPGFWFWRMTRPRRAGVRSAVSAVLVAFGAGYIEAPQVTVAIAAAGSVALAVTTAAGATWWAWRFPHRRKWIGPLSSALAERYGITRPPAVARDRKSATIWLPQDYSGDSKETAAIAALAVARLGIPEPVIDPQLAGPRPCIAIHAAAPPPSLVTMAMILPHIIASKADELVWGLSRAGAAVRTSLSGDAPHLGLSMGSGAGKSIMSRSLAAQRASKGDIVIILDFKQISHQWARDLPNIVIFREPAHIHAVLLELALETQRRNKVALHSSDLEGNVTGTVGPRLFIVFEEMNATMKAIRMWWRQQRDLNPKLPVRPPGLDALDLVNLMGRQVLMNLLYIGQRLSAKAAGGDGDVRESIGVIALGRWRDATWKMLAGDFAQPPKSTRPGLVQVVWDKVEATQGVYMSAVEARKLATSGRVAVLPSWLAQLARRSVVSDETLTAIGGTDQQFVSETRPVVAGPSGPVTLKQAVDQAIVNRTLGALRKASQRDPRFPAHVDFDGLAKRYDPVELALWDADSRQPALAGVS